MKKTIKNSMLTSYMILILLTACVMSGFYIYKNYTFARQQSVNEIEKESRQIFRELENLFEQIQIIQYQAVDILTQENSNSVGEKNIERKKLDAYKNMEEELMALRRSYSYIQDIFWMPRDSWICSTQSGVDRDKLLSGQAVRQLKREDAEPYMAVHRQDYLLDRGQGPYVFSYVKNIYSIYDIHSIKGVLQIDFKYEELIRRLEGINTSSDAVAYITDAENHIVFSPNTEIIGRPVAAVWDWMAEKNIDRNSYRKKYLLPNGWNLEVGMSYDSAAAYFWSNMKITVFLIVLFAAGASCYAYKASKRITYPLQQLTRHLTDMERSGQLKRLSVFSDLEELQILGRQYNGMAEQLDQMIETTAKARNETLRAKLSVLQMQINPHFLSNCFEMIRSQAVQSQNYEIEKITEALAMMYRYVLNDMEREVYLKDEIQYVKNYVRIQEFRFGETIPIFYHVDKSVLLQKIPGLTIQPLVENVFKHGFPGKGKDKIIIIRCVREGSFLTVSVQDNGAGIDADKLRQIRKMLEEDQEDKKDAAVHIGLKNVNYRLKIKYGQKAGLNIESTPENGTTVSFQMEVWQSDESTDC